jgi:hypothetical protein
MSTFRYAAAALGSVIALSACSGTGQFVPSTVTGVAPAIAGRASGVKTVVAKIVWGKLPAASAGFPFLKPLALTAKTKSGKTIKGAYSNPIVLSDNDASGATALLVNGKPASKNNPVKKSTDKISLKYTGLAIAPVTFSASAKGVKKKPHATFAPAVSGITYAGPTLGGAPELDLYATTGTGSSGSFTATQAGWSAMPYGKPYKYAFGPITGKTNNCPGTNAAAYTVSPASGAGGSAFAVTAKAGATAGECLMTIAGGAGKTLSVRLTYTSSGVGIGATSAR